MPCAARTTPTATAGAWARGRGAVVAALVRVQPVQPPGLVLSAMPAALLPVAWHACPACPACPHPAAPLPACPRYELCNILGLHVMDEANIETHGFDPTFVDNSNHPACRWEGKLGLHCTPWCSPWCCASPCPARRGAHPTAATRYSSTAPHAVCGMCATWPHAPLSSYAPPPPALQQPVDARNDGPSPAHVRARQEPPMHHVLEPG